jgi:hypothetical protein
MSDEWKDGYQQGFKDGYELGKRWQQPPVPNPFTTIPQEGWKPKQDWLRTKNAGTRCPICDMFFEYGKSYGYVCPHDNCPSRITCSTDHIVDNVGHIKTFSNVTTGQFSISDPGPVTDGLSYEEIYGSVIYQQNNKKEK